MYVCNTLMYFYYPKYSNFFFHNFFKGRHTCSVEQMDVFRCVSVKLLCE
jgi:hypothetical protein